MNLPAAFLDSVTRRFKEYKTLGDKTFIQLTGEDMLYQPHEESNSIAVIIQHLHGNMLSRWTNFLTEDGEKNWRKRDLEFETQTLGKEQMIQQWEEGWKVLLETLASLTEEDLLKTISIRSQPLIVIDAINRQLAHYSSHVGQIIYIGRMIRGKEWKSLSIPKGGSQQFNEKMQGSGK
ncbi:MAG: DUF1572 family protein [Flavisolibacter sp.]